jgi:hypothetical protein
VKNSRIIGLHHFPVSDMLQKLFPSCRNKIFDEFVKFKNNDGNVATLNISAVEPDEKNDARYVFNWNQSREYPNKMYVDFDHNNGEKLFTWDTNQAIGTQQRRSGNLPFEDEAFDWVFCDAVIEHIGDSERQYLLMKELMRVARKGIFVTTSNRWHPIEFYTALPLLHWLPASLWKRILRFIGKEIWASESMLNLLDAKALQSFVNRLPQKPQCSIGHIRVLGIKAYFFLQIRKHPVQNQVDARVAYQNQAY